MENSRDLVEVWERTLELEQGKEVTRSLRTFGSVIRGSNLSLGNSQVGARSVRVKRDTESVSP